MTKIFGRTEEQYLNAVVLYYKSADGILYIDAEKTEAASKAAVINLFKKGILVVDDGTNFVRPSCLTVATNYAEVSYTTVGASDKAVKTSFYSDGYSAAG